MTEVRIGLRFATRWPDGKPVRVEDLPDGRKRYELADGRRILIRGADHELEIQSTWIDAKPGDTYKVQVALIGLSASVDHFEAMRMDIEEVRNYAFSRTVSVTHLQSGEVYTGAEFEPAFVAALSERDSPRAR